MNREELITRMRNIMNGKEEFLMVNDRPRKGHSKEYSDEGFEYNHKDIDEVTVYLMKRNWVETEMGHVNRMIQVQLLLWNYLGNLPRSQKTHVITEEQFERIETIELDYLKRKYDLDRIVNGLQVETIRAIRYRLRRM